MGAQDSAEKVISGHKVAVFSKSYCPYCKSAKATLKSLNASDVEIVELDEVSEGSDIQDYLADKTGQRTVPNIFISGRHIGGNSDLQSLLSSGELQKLVA